MNYNKAEFYTSFGKFSQIPKSDRLEFAFSGRSNVGKSSLINKLLNRKNLARVSSMPGKTVTINFFSVENIYIVDLPGYGYASVSKSEKRQWGSLIGGYLDDGSRQLALVFQLVDMRHPPSKDDLMMINYLIDAEISSSLTPEKHVWKLSRQRYHALRTSPVWSSLLSQVRA